MRRSEPLFREPRDLVPRLRRPAPAPIAVRARAAAVRIAAAGLLLLVSCELGRHREPPRQVSGGDPARGRAALQSYACGACHTIPGVPRANGRVAPPLNFFADRGFVAGVLPNAPEDLIRWIMEPQAVNPETAMPDLGVREQDARDMAAYLYTLR